MKKLSFNILAFNIVNKKPNLCKKEGYQIDNDAVVYREKPYWYVTELVSGLSICKGKTLNAALENYHSGEIKEKIKRAHETDAYKHLKNIFKETKGQN